MDYNKTQVTSVWCQEQKETEAECNFGERLDPRYNNDRHLFSLVTGERKKKKKGKKVGSV